MKRLLLLLGLLLGLLLFLPGVSAVLTDNLIVYYSLDNADLSSGNPQDLTGNANHGTTDGATTGVSGHINQGFSFTTNDEVVYPDMSGTIAKAKAYSVNLWFKADATDGDLTIFFSSRAGADRMAVVIDSDVLKIEYYDGSTGASLGASFSDTSSWHMMTVTKAAGTTAFKLYIDGSDVGGAGAYGGIDNIDETLLAGAGAQSNSNFFEGDIDEVGIWNIELNSGDVTELYNSGDGVNPYGSASNDVSVGLVAPISNYHTNNASPVVLNYELNLTDVDAANCSLQLQSGGAWWNHTTTLNVLGNGTRNFNATLNETAYNWSARCGNGSIDGVSEEWTLYVDRTNPVWNILTSNFFTENSITYNPLRAGSELAQQNMTLEDTYLWAYNISYVSGGVTYHTNQTTNLTSTLETFDVVLNTSTWPTGAYSFSGLAEDDHTAHSIPEYPYTVTSQSIEWLTENGNTILVEAVEGNLRDIGTVKLEDRYTFFFDWQSARQEHQVDLSCDGTLYYRGGLYEWPTFVCYGPGGGNWVDFVPADLELSDLESVQVSQKPNGKYNINFKTVGNVQRMDFRSLGGLNAAWLNESFTLSRSPTMSQNLSNGTGIGVSWINVSWDDPAIATGSTLYNGSGAVLYNQTNGTTWFNVTGLAEATTYRFWVLSFYADNATGTMAYQYNTSSSSENNVSLSTIYNGSISIEYRDESSDELLTGVTITVSLISDLNNQTGTTTNGYVSITNLSEAGAYTVRSSAPGYGLRDYYYDLNISGAGGLGADEVLEGNGTNVNWLVYLINDTLRKGGKVTVRDTQGQTITGVVVKLARYFTDCNCYHPVQMITTDDKGEGLMDAEPYDGYYKFFIDYNDNNYFISSNPEAVYPETNNVWYRTFRINLGTDFYESFGALPNIGRSLTESFNNATNKTTHSFSWSDPTSIVTYGCYESSYLDGLTWESYISTCSAGTTGSIVAVLNDSNTVRYKYRAYVITSTAYSDETLFNGYLDIDSLTSGFSGGFPKLAAFLGGFLLVGVVLLFSYSAVLVMITSVIGAAFLSILGFMPFGLSFIFGLGLVVIGMVVWLMRR